MVLKKIKFYCFYHQHLGASATVLLSLISASTYVNSTYTFKREHR